MAKKKPKPKKPNLQDLRKLRHDVSILKNKGLVSKRVDARKQRPTRYMKSKVASLKDVIEGKSVGVKVSPSIRKQYKAAGFPVYNGRVIVTQNKDEIASAKKGQLIKRVRVIEPSFDRQGRERDGAVIEEVILPVSLHTIDEFVSYAIQNPDEINKLKDPEQVFAFKLNGFNSVATFATIELLVNDLMRYKSYDALKHVVRTEEVDQHWKGFILYRIYPPWEWFTQVSRPKAKRGYKKRWQDREGRMSDHQRTIMTLKMQKQREKKTAAMREYRKTHKPNEMQLAAKRLKDKERAAAKRAEAKKPKRGRPKGSKNK